MNINTNCYAALALAVMSVLVALAPTSNAMGICFGGGYPKCCSVRERTKTVQGGH